MAFFPRPEGVLELSSELTVMRDLTYWFIMADPTEIVLSTKIKNRTATGAINVVAGPVRPLQKFKLINNGGGGLVRNTDGTERDYPIILLGMWDAIVDIGDWWQDIYGNHFEVEDMIPYNSYEVRALVRSYGRDPHS